MATQPTTFLGQFFARLTSETPIFFKKFIAFGVTLIAVGTSILGLQEIKIIHFPDALFTIAQYMVGIGTAISIVAKSATTDPNLQAKGGSNVDVNNGTESVVADKAPKQDA